MALRGVNCTYLLSSVCRERQSLTSRSGKDYAKIEVEVTTVRLQSSEVEESITEFVPVVVFGKLGKVLTSFVRRGDPIHITAHVSSTQYETQAGEPKRSISIVADSIQLLASARREATHG